MCDYSLEMYGSRPAREGESDVTERFSSGSIGFVSPGDRKTAVCMACDTVLVLSEIPKTVQDALRIKAREQVTFTRLEEGLHRDGVRFSNGRCVSLQHLRPGIVAMIAKPDLPTQRLGTQVQGLFGRTKQKKEAELV
jgi:hypothetical protein